MKSFDSHIRTYGRQDNVVSRVSMQAKKIVDNRPQALVQRKLQEAANNKAKETIQRRQLPYKFSVIQRMNCTRCNDPSCNGDHNMVHEHVAREARTAAVNNVMSNFGAFVTGFAGTRGGTRNRLVGGTAAVAVNVAWGTADNIYNSGRQVGPLVLPDVIRTQSPYDQGLREHPPFSTNLPSPPPNLDNVPPRDLG